MIRINLVPGAKRVRSGASGAAIVVYVQTLAARVRDPYLAAAVVSVIAAVLFIGTSYLLQSARERAIAERQLVASADSARYAVIVRQRASAIASRDSTRRQLQIIRSIDDDRFVWPHVLDEVSRALPPYTWLTTLEQVAPPALAAGDPSARPSPQPAAAPAPGSTSAATAVAPPGPGSAGAAAAPIPVRAPPPRVHLVGVTVDIQALTRFMKDLEASPYIENVTLNKSDLIVADEKEVTRFELDCDYQMPMHTVLGSLPVTPQER